MTGEKIKILFVCTINRMRSLTAHNIYKDDTRFEVQSAGTSPHARIMLSADLLQWADAIIVMENAHRNFIRKKHPDIYKNKNIICLHIPDEYDYMQPELISILKQKVEKIYSPHQ